MVQLKVPWFVFRSLQEKVRYCMQVINSHIKNKEFKPVYLLYGSEDYLKKQYKQKLKVALLDGSDEMNYAYFEGKNIEIDKLIGFANTLPFFASRRVVVVENSGLFKAASDLADYLPTLPDTTVIIFVENEIDKRNKLYKAVTKLGVVSEMNGMDERSLKVWIASRLKQDGKRITEQTVDYFLSKTGSDMETINSELEKLICYALEKEIITEEEVDAVVTVQITNQIFAMIDAIASKKQKVALGLYYDLLALKEKPMTILFLITRHFNILLQVKELSALRYDNGSIAKKVGIPPFAVGKYMAQGRNFSKEMLLKALQTSVDIEEQVKTGCLNEKIGVELLIVQFSGS